jgi:DNA-binding CsgD family transcriptional regulator
MAAIQFELTDQDLRHALGTLQALTADCIDYPSFVGDLLERLPALVPSDLTTLSLCDLQAGTRRVVGRRGETLSDDDRAAFDRHFHRHPLVRYHADHVHGHTRRITDCLSLREFRASGLFAEYYRRIGMGYAMALPLRIDAGSLISVVFNRASSDFTDRERAALDVLRQPLAALYRHIMAREEARASLAALPRLAAGNGWHVARLGAGGRIADMPVATVRQLGKLFPGFAPAAGAELPIPLAAWIGRMGVAGMNRGEDGACAPLVLSRGGVKLQAILIPDPAAAGCAYLLVKTEPARIAADALSRLPLTARERQVMALVAAGKTNADIATLLEISPRTVQKHLEHAYQKLGVETRTAAAMRVVAAAGADTIEP